MLADRQHDRHTDLSPLPSRHWDFCPHGGAHPTTWRGGLDALISSGVPWQTWMFHCWGMTRTWSSSTSLASNPHPSLSWMHGAQNPASQLAPP